MKKLCPVCAKELPDKLAHDRRLKYCGRVCMALDYKNKFTGRNNSNWRGGKISLTCHYCDRIYFVIIANSHSKYCSNQCKNLANKGREASESTRNKMSQSQKRRILEGRHHLYKGGVTPVHEAIRRSTQYKNWRRAVINRDGRVCVLCTSENNIQVDHIKPFADYPELRFDINNGRVLCAPCHMKTDTYGFNRLKKKNNGNN